MKSVLAIFLFIGCCASNIYCERGSFEFEVGIVRNFHTKEHRSPVANLFACTLPQEYEYPFLNLSIAMSQKKNGHVHHMFQYRVLNAKTYISYDTIEYPRSSNNRFTQVNSEDLRYRIVPIDKKPYDVDSAYTTCLHIFDSVPFYQPFYFQGFTLFTEEGICVGYISHACTIDVKNITESADDELDSTPGITFSLIGESRLEDYRVNEWYLTCDDKKMFLGFSFIAGAIFKAQPLEIVSFCKLCPYVGWVSSDCHITTEIESFHETNGSSFCYGILCEVNNGIFWNIALENEDVRVGFSHNILLFSIGNRAVSTIDFIREDTLNKYLDKYLTKDIRQLFMSSYMVYSGYTFSVGMRL